MKEEILKTANAELEELLNKNLSWDNLQKIAILGGAISVVERKIEKNFDNLDEIIENGVKIFGEIETIRRLEKVFKELRKDLDLFSPNISAILFEKIKKIMSEG